MTEAQPIPVASGPYQAGRFYRVTVVRAEWWGPVRWWAVFGPRHDDAALLDFPHQHYHVDGRFIPPGIWAELQEAAHANKSGLLRHVFTPITSVRPEGSASGSLIGSPLVRDTDLLPTPDWISVKRRKCWRTETGYPDPQASSFSWLPKLRAAFSKARLGPDLVCPHQGGQLATIEPDPDGCVTCPMHGLRWDLATGRLSAGPGPDEYPLTTGVPIQ